MTSDLRSAAAGTTPVASAREQAVLPSTANHTDAGLRWPASLLVGQCLRRVLGAGRTATSAS